MIAAALLFLVWGCIGLQVYHYLGYPAALWLLARLRSRPVVTAAPSRSASTGVALDAPRVSLIVSAYDEAPVIAAKLENSLALAYPDLEVMVAAEGSSDDTAAIAASFADRGVVALTGAKRLGKSAALSAAAARASGEILVFSDANAFYQSGAITAIVASFADPDVGLVTGRKTIRPATGGDRDAPGGAGSEGAYWRYESLIKRLESRIDSTVATNGEILAIRRSLFTPVPAHIVNDDGYLALDVLRQGKRVVFEPEAVCWEPPSGSLAADATRRRRIAAGRFQLLAEPRHWPWGRPLVLWMLLSHKVLRLLLPLLMVGALVGNVAALLVPTPNWSLWATLLAQLGFYGLATLGAIGPSWRPARLALYVTLGNLSSLAGLWRHLAGRQSVLWEKVAR